MALLVATGNAGKLKEIRKLLSDCHIEVFGLKDVADAPEIIEDGDTFQANALKKAKEMAEFSGMHVLADDSGLVVDALGGRPGVYSARFAGSDADDAENNFKLLGEMRGVTKDKRRAAFCCSMALVTRDGRIFETAGRVEGEILESPQGDGGFGYDPLFWLPAYDKTMAELPLEEKNRISHRAQALHLMLPYLREL